MTRNSFIEVGMISKTFTTETSHIVRNASSIRCAENIHGHSYRWIVYIKGHLQQNGMVIDFTDLKPIKEFIDLFDHATVFWKEENEDIIRFFKSNFCRVIVMNKNCTAENMARVVLKFSIDWLRKNYPNCWLDKVEVWETATGCGIAKWEDRLPDYDDDILTYIHEDNI